MLNELEEAIALVKSGYTQEAREILMRLVSQESDNENVWMWLSMVAVSAQEHEYYLQQVLWLNPNNQWAKDNLAKLQPMMQPIVKIPTSRAQPYKQSGLVEEVRGASKSFREEVGRALGNKKLLIKHIVLTLCLALFLSFTCGRLVPLFTFTLLSPKTDTPASVTNAPTSTVHPRATPLATNRPIPKQRGWFDEGIDINLSGGVYFLPILAVMYFAVGYKLQGAWPHVNEVSHILNLVLGRRQTLRRHLTLTLIVVLLFQPSILGGISVAYYGQVLLHEGVVGLKTIWNSTIDWALYSLINFGLIYYLLSYVKNWQITQNTSYQLIDYQADKLPEVYEGILERMDRRQIPIPYTAKFVTATERTAFSVTEHRATTQLQVTFNRARVILRVLQYGTDLYIRWDSYLDLSSRRLWLINGLIFSFVNGIFVHWIGYNLYEFLATLWRILWGDLGRTGGKGAKARVSHLPFSTIFAPAAVDWDIIPSFMLDDLYALEDAVTKSAEEALDEIIKSAGWANKKVHLSIERNQKSLQRIF